MYINNFMFRIKDVFRTPLANLEKYLALIILMMLKLVLYTVSTIT